jgi:predicted membrane protein
LSPINSDGIQENTGLGIAVNKTSNDTYQIHQILSDGKYTIRVPQDIKVKVMNEGSGSSEIKIKNLNNDLEISTRNADINLENISGPVLINTIRGNVVGKFNQKVNTPISIISMYGEVDVSLPAGIRADLKLSSAHGNIFTDLPIEYVKNAEKTETVKGVSGSGSSSGGSSSFSYSTESGVASGSSIPTKAEGTGYTIYAPKASGSVALAPSVISNQQNTVFVSGSAVSSKPATQVRGKVNGGGGEIQLESRNNNIYLRKF